MERNPNDNLNQDANRTGGTSGGQAGGNQYGGGQYGGGQYGSTGGSTGAGSTGGQYGGAESGYGSQGGAQGGYGSQQGGSQGFGAPGGQEGRMDQVRDKAADLRGRAGELAGTVGEKAGQLKTTLADKLEAGANRLRGHDLGDGSAGGAYGTGTQQQRGAQVTNRVAGGMQATADWLRTAEIDDMRTGIERQARENPGRTLLIALGVGYLLGKAFRR